MNVHRRFAAKVASDGGQVCGATRDVHLCHLTPGAVDPETGRRMPTHLGPHSCECDFEWEQEAGSAAVVS